MIKKISLFVMCLVIGLFIITGCSNKEESSIKPNDFVGTWTSYRPTIEVSKESKNSYNIKVNWSSSDVSTDEWDYTCNFDDEKLYMSCLGTKNNYVFDDNGYETEKNNVLKSCEATFTIKDNKLYWNDKNEDMGKDIEFEKYN